MKYIAALPLFALMVGCNPGSSTNEAANNVPSQGELQQSYNTPAPTGPEEPKFDKPKDGEEVAVITTKFGTMVFKFREDKAPKHVENFKMLANKGFYDKTIFHRCMPGFMIQGGDPNTKDPAKVASYGQGGPGTMVKAEFNSISHVRGVVSMARSPDVDSAGSQFFVVVADSKFLDNQYTAFGEVVSGMDVADKIVEQPTGSRASELGESGKTMPNERIEMTVKIAKWPVK
jgi:peptidyl-prolyl cis-trans isomerase B (cyclophilin B)